MDDHQTGAQELLVNGGKKEIYVTSKFSSHSFKHIMYPATQKDLKKIDWVRSTCTLLSGSIQVGSTQTQYEIINLFD